MGVSEKFWATLGKVGLVAALIFGAIQVYPIVFPRGPKLEVLVFQSRFRYPAGLLQDFRQIRDLQSFEALQSWPTRIRPHLPNYDNYFTFQIANRGSKVAEGVAIELPYQGIYEVDQPQKPATGIDFERVIEVGEVRPNSSITVYVWTTWTLGFLENIRVKHHEGEASLRFEIPTTDFLNAGKGLGMSLTMRRLLGCLALLIFIGVLASIAAEKRQEIMRRLKRLEEQGQQLPIESRENDNYEVT
jgi:hypothetical protein